MSSRVDGMREAIETGNGLDADDIVIASRIAASPLREVALARMIAFCLAESRALAYDTIETGLEAAYRAGEGDPATLARILRAVRAARRA